MNALSKVMNGNSCSVRATSAYLIPMELLCGWILIVAGLAGLADTPLAAALVDERAERLWVTAFLATGAAMIVACALAAWSRHASIVTRSFSWRRTYRLAKVRAVLAFVAGILWLYAVRIGVGIWSGHDLLAISLLAPAMIAAAAVSFFSNTRVRYAVDPRISTPRLHFRL
jgi:hypothetical protein